MRTVIYVHEASTVTIREHAARDASALLYRYNQDVAQVASGTHALAAGIYLIVSSAELEVSGSHAEVVVLPNDKDIPPDPRLAILGLEPGATVQSVRQFLGIAKDISIDEPGDAPGDEPGAEPGAASGAEPGAEPGVEPGAAPGAEPGAAPGAEPASEGAGARASEGAGARASDPASEPPDPAGRAAAPAGGATRA